jgi:DNA repair protein RadA/Sms
VSRTSTVFSCRDCGTNSPRWVGRCPGCGEWNTLSEETVARRVSSASTAVLETTSLAAVSDSVTARVSSGVSEFDRVLGGGFVAGSSTLVFGEPGIGKSTLALMVLRARALAGDDVLLVAAEESPTQVAHRARRLGPVPGTLHVVASTDVASAAALLERRRFTVAVIDSISAMSDDSLSSVTGSVSQVRHAAERLCAVAKSTGTALVLVGHVTKDGELSGPRTLEHLVDTVVRVEGDRNGSLRLVRALKHRFGATGEVGLLEMGAEGLREVRDESLRSQRTLDVAGVVSTVTTDGSRSLVVEIQALVASSSSSPRRVAHQVSAQRLALLLAVLEARCLIDVSSEDVFAATAGGIAALEPAADLAIALAVASVKKGFVVPRQLVALGEVGLAGELREISSLTHRVKEAVRLGARIAVVPAHGELDAVTGVELRRCSSLSEAIAAVRT